MKVEILEDGQVVFLRKDITTDADKSALVRLFEMMLKAHEVDRQWSNQQIDDLLARVSSTAPIRATVSPVQTIEGQNEIKIVLSFETLLTL